MGTIANDMIDGLCCEKCGQYFENPKTGEIYIHNHPVSCWECYDELSKKEKKNNCRSNVKTF